MDERFDKLGFNPQKELVYNKLLVYSDEIDKESLIYLAEVKTNLGKAVLCRDLRDISFWASHLLKYIQLYGRKFSKNDHIIFIKLLFELLIVPDIELSFVNKVCILLKSLLKKTELLSREDLVLPWRPLYELYERIIFSQYENLGMLALPSSLEGHLKSLIFSCRPYFSVESTQEILDEFRPYMCPFDSEMAKAINYFELFLCTSLPPAEHHRGFKLWFDELMGLWKNLHNIYSWENSLLWLFSRLAKENIGYINWEPYIPMIFTKLLRCFNLPGRSTQLQVCRVGALFDTVAITNFMASMLGAGSSCQLHIAQLFKALESYYHPSNYGRWLNKIQKFLRKLPVAVVKRLHRERTQHLSWMTPVPKEYQLTNNDITEFVKSVLPAALLSMFSKRGCLDSVIALQNLGVLRPEIVIPPLLERLYPSFETLTEPHRLTAAMHCIIPVARSLVRQNKFYPEGPSHVIPLLMGALPGIDPNDIKKCMITFQFISTLVTLVLLIDLSSAVNSTEKLPEDVQEVCLATAAFEDFVLQFMDRCFVLIENSCLDNPSRLDRTSERTNPEENFLEVGVFSTFGIIISQSSPAIYEVALSKLQTFITSHILEINVSGKYAANMCRIMSRVNPEKALQSFVPHFTKLILALTENEELINEEKLDDELLFSLLVLSEVVRCDGKILLKYQSNIEKVLERSLNLKCKDGYKIACSLLNYALKIYVQCYPIESCSIANPWDRHSKEEIHQYLNDWGVPGDINNLNVKWHTPTEEELLAAESLLAKFLVPELEKLHDWATKKITLPRETVHRSLSIVLNAFSGAALALPLWPGEQLSMRESSLPPYQPLLLHCGSKDINIDGKNVRQYICDVLQLVLKYILECCEDDTKALTLVIKLYHGLMFNWGMQKEELDTRWKAFHLSKNILENKLYGEKKHIRSHLIDRIHLQHELRVAERFKRFFTETHVQLMKDLLKLSTSHYSEIRKSAQTVLQSCMNCFHSSCRIIFPEILELLQLDPTTCHEEFKGILYVILGHKGNSFLTLHNWELISELWPTIVSSKHSEKPSIIKLLDNISATIQKYLPTTQIKLVIPDQCIDAAKALWNSSVPLPASPMLKEKEISDFSKLLVERSDKKASFYYKMINDLKELIKSGNLHWRHYHLALSMLSILIRYDMRYPKDGVELFVSHLIHETLAVRKIAMQAVVCLVKQHKRKHLKVTIDPDTQINKTPALHPVLTELQPKEIPDNFWLQYNSADAPDTKEKWDSKRFVHKTHWGFYAWPKSFEVYAPDSAQPKLDRTREELTEEEKPIYDAFSQESFVNSIISYFSLEERKGLDKFDAKKFYIFRGLFANFGDTFLPNFVNHLHSLTVDKQESSQRCATEIISGLLSGSKHWNFEKMHKLKDTLSPIIEKALRNILPETLNDWATCLASFSKSRDPNKYYWLFELMMTEPGSIESGSFLESSWLYLLTGLIAQQEWRVSELLNRTLSYIEPRLNHSYQNVREKMGSLLGFIFLYDVPLYADTLEFAPKRTPFLKSIVPKLSILELKDDCYKNSLNCQDESDEKKNAKNLFRTVCRWLQHNTSRSLYNAPPEIFQLLPTLCHAQNDNDDTFKKECDVTIAILGHSLLTTKSIEAALSTLKNIVSCHLWHSRLTATTFLQVMIFSNLFTVMQNKTWTQDIYDMVLKLLEDERVEVRESAAETLCGFLHCEYFKITEELLDAFKKKIRKNIKNKRLSQNGLRIMDPDELRERHVGILGLCACVNAFPYDVPKFLPDILVLLGDHLHDPQPIEATIKKTLSSFRRTHYDNWRDHKLKFTDDQLAVITDLLVSPNYYA